MRAYENKKNAKMIGVARTVQLNQPNDFLTVLHALINTSGSTRAVAGSLFSTEAERRGCRGLVGMGRGLFASGDIQKGELVRCAVQIVARNTSYLGTNS